MIRRSYVHIDDIYTLCEYMQDLFVEILLPLAFGTKAAKMTVMLEIYGIKNCDTVKKALAWLDQHGVAYTFHDYKKEGADKGVIAAAIADLGWEAVINRKGTTWRALPETMRDKMSAKSALAAALDNPSLIKRPLIVAGKTIYVGFDVALYKKAFG